MNEPTKLRNRIGSISVEDGSNPDCLAIALCCYFDHHMDRPEDDPTDDDTGWGEWVARKTNEALERITSEVHEIVAIPPPARQAVAVVYDVGCEAVTEANRKEIMAALYLAAQWERSLADDEALASARSFLKLREKIKNKERI